MSRINDFPIPPELLEVLDDRPAQERKRIRRVWHLLGLVELDEPAAPDTETAFADLGRRLFAERRKPAQRPALDRDRRRPRRQWVLGAAACTLALFTLVGFWRMPVAIETRAGEQLVHHLPDGSTIQLNSGSSIEYARRFESWPLLPARRRHVVLSGEAFFDVEPGARPFVVESFNAEIRVMGTGFNVYARSTGPSGETTVTLSHGRVRVVPDHAGDRAVMLAEPGASVSVLGVNDAIRVETGRQRPLDRVLAWRRRGFFAVDTPLSEVVEEIERRYALSIDVEPTVDASRSVNVFLESPGAEDIVNAICLALSCRYRKNSGGFVIF